MRSKFVQIHEQRGSEVREPIAELSWVYNQYYLLN